MSGDAGGLIAALVFAPVVLAGAAVAGIAYGTIKIGGALVSAAVDYSKKKHAEKTLAVNNCSAELETLYQRMASISASQSDTFRDLSVQTQQRLQSAAAQLNQQAENAAAPDFTVLNNTIRETHTAVNKIMANHAEKVKTDIIAPAQRQLADCANAMEKVSETRAALVDWKQTTQAAKAEQKAMAYNSLRDALASIQLMDKLSASWQDPAFRQQYDSLKNAYSSAQTHFDNGLYEASFSDSRKVIRQVALSVAAQQANQMERDFASMQLQARISGLMEEMEKRRYLHIPAGKDCDEALDEDLDEYSQGQYSATQKLLQQKLEEARGCANHYQLDKLTREYEEVLEPRAVKVMEVSQQVMQGHHEKLKVLEVVADFMEGQNYTMDWVTPVGDDLSQKLVVHFVNNFSGSSIAVTLDNRAESGDVARMAMEVLTFYQNGNEVTEAEKQKLRSDLNAALAKAGVQGQLGCNGQVGLPSSQPEMNTENGVLNKDVRKIL